MRNLVAIPLLGLAVILQSAIVGQFPLLDGTADLILVIVAGWALQKAVTTGFHWAFLGSVFISLVSSLPWLVYFVGYVAVVALALLLQSRIWQVPLLAMFAVTFLGTVVLHALTYLYMSFAVGSISVEEALGLITLPSILLNMVIAIPVFAVTRDVARWVFPAGAQA
jgi:hypothetical protein